MTLAIAQSSRMIQEGWWDWSIWLTGEDDEIGDVDTVVYHLHPTFPDPERTVTDRTNRFRLQARGWGEFMIRARVNLKNGTTADLSHWLELSEPEPAATPASRTQRVYLSHSAVDAPMAEAVKSALRAEGLEVVSDSDSIPVGSSFSGHLTDLIESADRVVAVVSDSTGPWVESEVKKAEELHIPVSVVGVGEQLPQWASPSVVLKPELDADDISAALRGRL